MQAGHLGKRKPGDWAQASKIRPLHHLEALLPLESAEKTVERDPLAKVRVEDPAGQAFHEATSGTERPDAHGGRAPPLQIVGILANHRDLVALGSELRGQSGDDDPDAPERGRRQFIADKADPHRV